MIVRMHAAFTLKHINGMKLVSLGLCLIMAMGAQWSCAQQKAAGKPVGTAEQEVINFSKEKWHWMAERKVDTLDALFHAKAVFVHMGGISNKEQELAVIKGGMIQYKHAEIHETSVQIIGATVILLSRIHLLAVVGGNEVTNPFVVTEVYVKQKGRWTLGSLSFTRTLGD